MNNEDIVKYCMTSPENINPAVLRSMLDGLEGGGDDDFIKIMTVKTTLIDEEQILDKTWQEIIDFITLPYHFCYIQFFTGLGPETNIMIIDKGEERGGLYYLYCFDRNIRIYADDGPNSYPILNPGK